MQSSPPGLWTICRSGNPKQKNLHLWCSNPHPGVFPGFFSEECLQQSCRGWRHRSKRPVGVTWWVTWKGIPPIQMPETFRFRKYSNLHRYLYIYIYLLGLPIISWYILYQWINHRLIFVKGTLFNLHYSLLPFFQGPIMSWFSKEVRFA